MKNSVSSEEESSTMKTTNYTTSDHAQLVAGVLGDKDGFHFDFLPGGRLHSIRNGAEFMLNLTLGCPLSGAAQRLYVELNSASGSKVLTLWGPGSKASFALSEKEASWKLEEAGVTVVVRLAIHASKLGWTTQVELENATGEDLSYRVLQGQDVGLSHVGAARINESYTSQYLDHASFEHPEFGHVVATRQNLKVDGKHPVLLQACLNGAAEYSSEGRDFFGSPSARTELLPLRLRDGASELSGIRQGEMSYVSLFSASQNVAAGASASCQFASVLVEDHEAATSPSTLGALDGVADQVSFGEQGTLLSENPDASVVGFETAERSIFDAPAVVHGQQIADAAVQAFYPEAWALEERSEQGALWSFFYGDDSSHVVTRAKEEVMGRPHGTILRSGHGDAPSPEQLTTSCFAAGIFHSLMSAGHTSFNRLLNFPREACGLTAATGQRIWISNAQGSWNLLGVPSVFEMGMRFAKWIYVFEDRTIEVVSSVDAQGSGCDLVVKVIAGESAEFLVTSGLIGGIGEYDAPANISIDLESGVARVQSQEDSMWRSVDPDGAFEISVSKQDALKSISSAAAIQGGADAHAMLLIQFNSTAEFTVEMTATGDKLEEVPSNSWSDMASSLKFRGGSDSEKESVERLNAIVPWYVHNGMIHFTVPHGVEQYNGGAWGSRDVTQGSVELLLAFGSNETCREVILDVYRHQYEEGHHWPQWFMLQPFGEIMQSHSHGDIPMWPIKSLCDYLEVTNDFGIFNEQVGWTTSEGKKSDSITTLGDHVQKNLQWLRDHCVKGTALISYGDGDWNDSLQPAKPELKENLVSAWSVSLCYQTVSRLAAVSAESGIQFDGLEGFAEEIRKDFHKYLIIDDTVCGFYLFNEDGTGTPLLHPNDERTGISYRLLPMTRSMIGGLFTAEEASHHNALISEHLLAADGARLMNQPPKYKGGENDMFQRAETSPCFSREIGIFYTHAHLRYIEAMARLGKADLMWEAIGKVNPAGIKSSVKNALPRQANAYFSSSDANVATRYEADENYDKIKSGEIEVEGGWRIYSSGPGIFLQVVMRYMVGLRRRFDMVEIDPVIPKSLDGLEVEFPFAGKSITIKVSVSDDEFAPKSIELNGSALVQAGTTDNPYRTGGWQVDAHVFDALLNDENNTLSISL